MLSAAFGNVLPQRRFKQEDRKDGEERGKLPALEQKAAECGRRAQAPGWSRPWPPDLGSVTYTL